MPLSQEFLREVYKVAKKHLPGWAYTALMMEARAKAGGQMRGKNWVSKPYENEHAARQKNPGQYERFRRTSEGFPKGISVIFGITKGNAQVQSIRFDSTIWDVEDARKWLKENDFQTRIEEATAGDEVLKVDGIPKTTQDTENMVEVTKANSEKQIVYGVVFDPYGENGATPDAHGDWPTPAMIEETAHAFLQGNKTIGLQHSRKANAMLVESSIEQYPTVKDYQAAMEGRDHSVRRRTFGTDKVHSGSWVVGVQLGNTEWAMYKKGELNAFSPGGVGIKRSITEAMLPKVEFLDE